MNAGPPLTAHTVGQLVDSVPKLLQFAAQLIHGVPQFAKHLVHVTRATWFACLLADFVRLACEFIRQFVGLGIVQPLGGLEHVVGCLVQRTAPPLRIRRRPLWVLIGGTVPLSLVNLPFDAFDFLLEACGLIVSSDAV